MTRITVGCHKIFILQKLKSFLTGFQLRDCLVNKVLSLQHPHSLRSGESPHGIVIDVNNGHCNPGDVTSAEYHQVRVVFSHTGDVDEESEQIKLL